MSFSTWIGSGMKPLVRNSDSAAAWLLPTTFGTVPSPTPWLTMSSTVEPSSTFVWGFGFWSKTSSAGMLSFSW